MDKTVKIIGLHDILSDRAYWMTKTPQERLAAVAILREQYARLKGIQPGLQRVYQIIELKK